MKNLQTLDQKKKLLDKKRPLPPELVQNLDEWFNVELAYTSNAIEGNTLTRQETAFVIEKGLTVKGKSLVEHLEATNHSHALNFVKEITNFKPSEITEKHILLIHSLILKGIDDPSAGKYRSIAVRISGSTVIFPNPVKVLELMAGFIDWLHTATDHPILIAAKAHYKLVTIHPFVDGNGRTARLLMNLLLISAGYPPAIISPENRLEYTNALEKAQLGGSCDDFYQIIFDAVDASLDVYLNALS